MCPKFRISHFSLKDAFRVLGLVGLSGSGM